MLNKTFKTNPSFLKMLLLLFFMTITLNAADYKGCDYLTKEAIEEGDLYHIPYKTKLECLEGHNNQTDKWLNMYYKQIMNSSNLPQANKTAIKQNQRNWLKQRDNLCGKHKKNRTRYLTCFIGETIPKVNEFVNLDIKLSKKPFEGKWEVLHFDKFSDDDYPAVYRRWGYSSWLMEENGNICGELSEAVGFRSPAFFALLRSKDNHTAHAVKMCDYCRYEGCVPCYDDYYKEAIDFSEWKTDDSVTTNTNVYIHDANNFEIRKPFKPGEREKLIKENKWLQDCLNYKGE